MGLDITFDRTKAVKAGIKFETLPNATPEQIEAAKDDPDEGYQEWLASSQQCIEVPGFGHFVSDDGVGDFITVRANKWGRTYKPLTQWLVNNNIEWDEW